MIMCEADLDFLFVRYLFKASFLIWLVIEIKSLSIPNKQHVPRKKYVIVIW